MDALELTAEELAGLELTEEEVAALELTALIELLADHGSTESSGD